MQSTHQLFTYVRTSRPNFFCYHVVLESICYRTRAKRLINDSKTTGELKKLDGIQGSGPKSLRRRKKGKEKRRAAPWLLCRRVRQRIPELPNSLVMGTAPFEFVPRVANFSPWHRLVRELKWRDRCPSTRKYINDGLINDVVNMKAVQTGVSTKFFPLMQSF